MKYILVGILLFCSFASIGQPRKLLGLNPASPYSPGYIYLDSPRNQYLTHPLIAINDSTMGMDTVEYVVKAGTQTLTNKRITARYGSTTSSATPTINTDNYDTYELTAQTAAITSFTTNLSGTPTADQILHIIITGTAARAIAWGASFEASTVPLPTTTVLTNRLDVYFVYNIVTSKWRCGGVW